MIRAARFAPAVLLVFASGCAGTAITAPGAASASQNASSDPVVTTAVGKAARVAEVLMTAARAEQAHDGPALARAVLRLEFDAEDVTIVRATRFEGTGPESFAAALACD